MLPDKLGDFVVATGANVYVKNLRHDSEALNLGAEFGLGATYNAENDVVTVTVGPRAVDLGGVVGVVALYRVLDTRTDLKLREIEFDANLRRTDGSFVIRFANTGEDKDLYALAQLVLPSGKSMNSLAEVLVDTDRKPDFTPINKPMITKRQNGGDPSDGIVNVDIIVRESELHDVLVLDFSRQEPVRVGNAALSYTGGGNRYLVGPAGPVLQSKDVAPWSLEAGTMIEPAGGNMFSAYALTRPAYTMGDNLVMNVSDMRLSAFNETFKNFRGTNTNPFQTTWEVVFDAVSWDGESVSASAFLEFVNQGTANCRVGLRMYDGSGNHLRDVFNDVPTSALNVYGAAWTRPANTPTVPGRVHLVVRVEAIGAGETISVVAGLPQIESLGGIGTRSTAARDQDNVSCSIGYAFETKYGRLSLEVTPNYEGVPGGYGPQIFFDSRDASGLNGFYLGHQANGQLEFGMADNVGSVYVRSASAVQLSGRTRISCFWDVAERNMRIDVAGSIAVDKNLQAMTEPTSVTLFRFGSRFDGSNRGSFEIHVFEHMQTQD